MIRVLLADDDALVRGGLRALLAAEDGIEVVGEAANGHQAVHEAKARRVDVVVMDICMPVRDGVSATRELMTAEPRPRVLVLTTFDLDDVVDDAIVAGADGFLLKRASPEELVAGIRAVAEGETVVSPSAGRSNTEIAEALHLSVETVKTHVKHVLTKLEVRDRTQAVVWAYRTGFTYRT